MFEWKHPGWIWGFLLLFLSCRAEAQHIELLHFDIDNGIPSNTIYSLTRQKNGYLWLSTDKGVSKFNGLNFVNFSTFDSLPDNDVFSVREDYEGRIWFASFNGVLCYYKDNHFFSAKNTSWLKLPFKSNILRIFLQRDSSLNVVFQDQTKLAVIRHNSLRIVNLPLQLNQNLLYVGTRADGRLELYYTDFMMLADSNGKGSTVIRDWSRNRHAILIPNSMDDMGEYYGTPHGIYDLNEHQLLQFKKTKVIIEGHVPFSLYDNNIFLAQVDHFSINDSIMVPTGEHVTTIQRDYDGNFWISTLGNGLFYMSKHFLDLKIYNGAYEGRVVYSRYLKGALLLVTGNGTVYELKKGVIRQLFKGEMGKFYLTESNFYITDEGDLLKMVADQVTIVRNVADGGRTPVSYYYRLLSSVKKTFEDSNYIYIVGSTDIERLDKQVLTSGKWKGTEPVVKLDGNYNRILAKAMAPDGAIWYSVGNHIFRYKDGIVTKQPQLSGNPARFMEFMGAFLVTLTEDNNLVVYNNYAAGKVQQTIISEPNCVWGNFHKINEQTAIITSNNYYRMLTLQPVKNGQAPEYRLQAVENPFVPSHAEYVVSDARNCYFLKNGTLAEVPLNVLMEAARPPKIVFTQLVANDATYPVDSVVHIPFEKAKSIHIKFDIISFVSKERIVEYSIARSGQDEWSTITGNEINLNFPWWGSYRVKVRAKTVSSGFSKPEELTIYIETPFWAKWKFIVLALIVIGVLIWLVVRFFIRRRLKKTEMKYEAERKFQQSEYKALNALMNPHFIFNSLNNIQGFINKDSKETANEYLVIFSRLVRQNMINLSKGFISLEQELNLVENYLILEKMRFKELVNFSIDIDKNVELDSIMIPPLLIQPVVENAVVHGLLPRQRDDSYVRVFVSESEDLLEVRVRDNGVGLTQSFRNKNMERESYGLLNLNKRIEHLKKINKSEIRFEIREIFDEHGRSCGTEAIIKIEL